MTTAIHWSGLLLVAGAVVLAVAIVVVSSRPVVGQALSPGSAALLLVAAALLLLALPAMYAVQADKVGVVGLAAYVLLATGLLLPVLVAATPLLYPSLNAPTVEHPLVFVLGIALTLGLLLTGIVTLQADVYPRPAALLLLGATAGFFFVFFVAEFLPPVAGQAGSAAFGVMLALGFAWIGVVLWQRG
ncbi:MAG TPA: hypothetical protein VIZ22_01915 [Candidatus Limnocylindrales bacterium]